MNLSVAGYDVTTISNGTDTLNLIQKDHSFDLALLDVMLPGIDGFELLKHMQKYNIPVIYLTAKNDIASKLTGLRGGAEDYIVKPFEILELLVRIEKVVERSGKSQQIINIDDIEIDILCRVVKQYGEEVPLKPLEFDVLVMLAKNKNIALSRKKLLADVWDIDFMGETRTVDVHIGQLRKKLDISLVTIPKVGYRLEG